MKNLQCNRVNNENCKAILEDFKKTLLPIRHAKRKIREWFSHESFKKSYRPKDLEEEVVRNSQLKIVLFFEEEFVNDYLSCSMPLGGGAISFKRDKANK